MGIFSSSAADSQPVSTFEGDNINMSSNTAHPILGFQLSDAHQMHSTFDFNMIPNKTIPSPASTGSQAGSVSHNSSFEVLDATTALRDFNFNWLLDAEKVQQVKNMKDVALGNARILYGSERFKYYDIILAESNPDATFCAILTVAQDNATKVLRRAMASCPLKAVREIVQGLQVDTATLFTKYSLGSQLRGQQGYTSTTGVFTLDSNAQDEGMRGAVDDTATLRYAGVVRNYRDQGVPRGPRAERGGGVKRVRFEERKEETYGRLERGWEEGKGEELDYGS